MTYLDQDLDQDHLIQVPTIYTIVKLLCVIMQVMKL